MKTKFSALLLAVALMLAIIPVVGAQGPAYQTSFTTSITYQNVGTGSSTVSIDFYDEGEATAVTINQNALPAGAGASIFVGNVNTIGANFRGSAVLNSSEPIVATLVQVPQGNNSVKNRPLSNGFDASQGAAEFLVPTTLKARFNTTTVFSVQNVGGAETSITVAFFDADSANPGTALYTTTAAPLPANAAKYFDLGQISQLPNNFNGSAVVTATGGSVVASAMELSTNGAAASAFEGVQSGSNTVYMASALCQAFGGTTSYAVQNTGDAAASVTVTYQPGGSTATATIQPGAKASFVGCTSNNPGFSGSAVITSNQPVVAIGKVFGATTTAAYSTAFGGASAGAAKIALPYVRWSNTQYNSGARQRAFIAIQNVGTDPVSGVYVSYVNSTGVEVCRDNLDAIAPGAKANSNPILSDVNGANCGEFGFNADNTTGGGAIVQGPAGSSLIAVVRIQSINAAGQAVAEDYNGTVVP